MERFLERRGRQDMQKEQEEGKQSGDLFQAEVVTLYMLVSNKNKTPTSDFLKCTSLERTHTIDHQPNVNKDMEVNTVHPSHKGPPTIKEQWLLPTILLITHSFIYKVLIHKEICTVVWDWHIYIGIFSLVAAIETF